MFEKGLTLKKTSVLVMVLMFVLSNIAVAQDLPDDVVATVGEQKITRDELATEFLKHIAEISDVNPSFIERVHDCLSRIVLEKEAAKINVVADKEKVAFYKDQLISTKQQTQIQWISKNVDADAEYLALLFAFRSKKVEGEPIENRKNLLTWLQKEIIEKGSLVSDMYKLPVNVAATWNEENITALELVKKMMHLKENRKVEKVFDLMIDRILLLKSDKAKDIKEEDMKKYFDENRVKFTGFKIKIAYILASFQNRRGGSEDENKTKAKNRIDRIYKTLSSGRDSFVNLAYESSEDIKTKSKYGVFGWINDKDNQNKKLAAEALKLKNNGDISKPVEIDRGYGIIKLLETKELPDITFESCRDQIAAEMIRKNITAPEEYKLIQNLKAKYKVVKDLENAFK